MRDSRILFIHVYVFVAKPIIGYKKQGFDYIISYLHNVSIIIATNVLC